MVSTVSNLMLFSVSPPLAIWADGAYLGVEGGEQPGRVLMFVEEGESIANTIKPRLRGAGADMRMIDVVDCVRKAGAPIAAVKSIMRHASIATTNKHYTHLQ